MISRKATLAPCLTLTLIVSAALLRPQPGIAQVDAEQQSAWQAAVNKPCDIFCQLQERLAQQVEGSWNISITPVVPPGVPPVPSFVAYLSFARGGAVVGSGRNRPFNSPLQGAWQHLGGNQFAYTVVQDEFDSQGVFQGTLKIKARLTLTSPNEFAGVAAETRNAAGEVTATRCVTFKAERIQVEPLPSQCQTIAPPQ